MKDLKKPIFQVLMAPDTVFSLAIKATGNNSHKTYIQNNEQPICIGI
ncbi:hypothetical protein [Negadavirga shengliensis]|uniref:Uncharacterized protein n=1 Tax=Negadavirga shengliensis TaxID=1389218 RepID=A0ABV9SUS1_9BACT